MRTLKDLIAPFWYTVDKEHPDHTTLFYTIDSLLSIWNETFPGFDPDEDEISSVMPSPTINKIAVHWWQGGRGCKIDFIPFELWELPLSKVEDEAKRMRYERDRDEATKRMNDAIADLAWINECRMKEL